jgi:hypothetical protein
MDNNISNSENFENIFIENNIIEPIKDNIILDKLATIESLINSDSSKLTREQFAENHYLNENSIESIVKKNYINFTNLSNSISDENSKNLLLIGYCNLEDGFLYAAKALEKLNYNIFFFPYLSYVMDKIEERDEILVKIIKENNINICLWWNNAIKIENYEIIFNKLNNIPDNLIKHYFYNWDPFLYNYDKYNSLLWKNRIIEKEKYYSMMHHVLSCFETEIKHFKNLNSNFPIIYNHPGFDSNISYYIHDINYECDVSIVCTNLYKDNEEFPENTTNISRYLIVDKLYKNRDKIKFHIYGVENFKYLYPDCYKGFIKYDECNKVFSNSKINLSIHPLVNELNSKFSNEEYFSERVPQILGCKGLLMTNSYLTNILKPNKDYIYIDNTIDWFQTIINIIENNNTYNKIRENGQIKALQYYTWDNWANKINNLS